MLYLSKLMEERKPDEVTIAKQMEEHKEHLRKSYEEDEEIKEFYPSYEEYEAVIINSLKSPYETDPNSA